MNDRSRGQLAALGGVVDLFEQAGIDYWLFGGWAVDFHAGSVTRLHDDLDLAIWLHDHPRIAELLQKTGWMHMPRIDEDGGTGYEQGAVRLELTFLVRAEDKSVYVPLRRGRAAWPHEALANDVIEMLGTSSRVVPLAPLLASKSAPRSDPDDAAKDRADFAVLCRLTGAEEGAPPTSR